MNVNMHNQLRGLSHTGNEQSQLEEDIQIYADAIVALQEKRPGSLENASTHQARMRQETIDELHEYCAGIKRGKNIIYAALHASGEQIPEILAENLNSDFFLQGLEEGSEPSELLGLSFDTLTRFYTTLNTLFQQQEYVKVRDGFHFMTFLCPKTAQYWSALGLIEIQLQKYDKAEEAYLRALELDPSSQEIYLGCLHAYIEQQEFAQAEALCDKGILYARENNNMELERSLLAAKQEVKCTEKEEL